MESERDGVRPPLPLDYAAYQQANFVETLQRAVLVTLNQTLLFNIIQWPIWAFVANETNGSPHFYFHTVKETLEEFDMLEYSEISTINAMPEWEYFGGARGYIQLWRRAIEDLLGRLHWIRNKVEMGGSTFRKRIQLMPDVHEDAETTEQKLCRARRVLEQSYDELHLCSAGLWQSMGEGYSRCFWEVWWDCAVGKLGFQDTKRRIDELSDAARFVMREDPSRCLEELEIWLSEQLDWVMTRPNFLHAVDCLSLSPYVNTWISVNLPNPISNKVPRSCYATNPRSQS